MPSPNTKCVIGLDVGGSKIAGGVVLFPAGQIFSRKVVPTTPIRGGEAVLADSLKLVSELQTTAQAAQLSVLAVGVVVCELVDLQGTITSDQTVKWRGMPLGKHFSQFAPTVIEADVRAAALAEARFGAGRGLDLFVYVTVGTGISYSLVQNAKPFAGARGNAMLLGSSPLGTTGGDTSAPTLEDIASGPALVARYNRATRKQYSRAEQVFTAAEMGDTTAVDVLTHGGEALGMGVGFLVNLLDPQAIIVGGGLGLADGLYWEQFVVSTRRYIWSPTNRELPLLHGALGTDAAMLGAATLAWSRLGAAGQG